MKGEIFLVYIVPSVIILCVARNGPRGPAPPPGPGQHPIRTPPPNLMPSAAGLPLAPPTSRPPPFMTADSYRRPRPGGGGDFGPRPLMYGYPPPRRPPPPRGGGYSRPPPPRPFPSGPPPPSHSQLQKPPAPPNASSGMAGAPKSSQSGANPEV